MMSGIDICSSVPLHVTAKFGDQRLSEATAFLWLIGMRHFLVTNWHVVTGRNHETGKCLADHGGVPDRLEIAFPTNERSEPPIMVVVKTIDEEGEPRWTEHPIFEKSVDIAVLPIDPPSLSDSTHYPMNLVPMAPIKQRIGMPLFILGYPFGRKGYGMPVWKQGSFASEPFMAPDFDRYLIVDTASRPGMSGSPVVQRVHGIVEFDNGKRGPTNGDGACRFVGIYSGRFHTSDSTDAQLGRVWPARLVEEVVTHANLWVPKS